MGSLRRQLIHAFLFVILTLTITTLVLFVLNLRITQEYKKSSDVMIAEYQLIESGKKMNELFNTIMLSLGTNSEESERQLAQAQNNIKVQKLFLEKNIVDFQSKSNYLGFEASIDKSIDLVNSGITRFREGNIDTYFDDYNSASKQFEFVLENGKILVFGELAYIASIRDQLSTSYRNTIIFALTLLTVLASSCLFYVIHFSKKLIAPLQNLTGAAKQLAIGNDRVTIQKEVLQIPNEIGILANSFSKMAITLQNKVLELNESNIEIARVAKNFESKNNELHRLNKFMVDREVKMVALKEEIALLKKQLESKRE